MLVAPTTTKRYYSLGSTVVAVRDSATTQLNYLLGDQLGSTTVSVNSSGGTPVVQRYLPYGAPRSTTGGAAVTDRGWIGQTNDSSTGLQYLNARYYDPVIGRFTATDPIIDTAQPGSLDRFGYGYDNPVTLSDPTGLWVPVGQDARSGVYHASWPRRVSSVTNRPTQLRLPGHRYARPTGPRMDPNRKPPKGPGDDIETRLDELISDFVSETLEDFDDVGTCGHLQAVAALGVTGAACDVSIGGDDATVLTTGLSAGHEGVGGGVGRLLSNADHPHELGGKASCLSGGYSAIAGGSVTACASYGDNGLPNGVFSIYPAFEVATPGPTGSYSLVESYVYDVNIARGPNCGGLMICVPFILDLG